mgnify:CR=1 FL=1
MALEGMGTGLLGLLMAARCVKSRMAVAVSLSTCRCLALLDACQVWSVGPQLLMHLTALHVEAAAQWATSGGPGAAGPAAAAAAAAAALDGGGASLLWHRLRLQVRVEAEGKRLHA